MPDPASQMATLLARLAADLPEVEVTALGADRWAVTLPGTVRWRLPVLVESGRLSWAMTAFVLRGPEGHRGDPAGLHRHLLRRNRSLRLARFWLDEDDDVLLGVRLPRQALTADMVQAALAELLEVSEAVFEPLVHLGYPNVFPRLARIGDGKGPNWA